MEFFQIPVDRREICGSTAVRRLRREGHVPGVLYGMGRPNLNLQLGVADLQRFLRSPSHLVELSMGDKTRPAILRELQIDALTDEILHADFTRVAEDVAIEDTCHIATKGMAKGIGEGGVFQKLLEQITVKALPRALPGELILDVTGLGLGDHIYVRDLEFADGIEVITSGDELVCQVAAPKAEVEETDEEGEGEAEAVAEGGEEAAAT